MTGGRPAPASFDASLRGEDRLVLDDRHDQAAAEQFGRLRERALGRRALRELDDRQVVLGDGGPELQIGGRDDDRLRRQR